MYRVEQQQVIILELNLSDFLFTVEEKIKTKAKTKTTLASSPTYNLYSNFTFNKADILIPFGTVLSVFY